MHQRGWRGYTLLKSAKTQGSQQLINQTGLDPRQCLDKSSACRKRNVNSNRLDQSPWIGPRISFLFKRLTYFWKLYCWNIFIHSLFFHLVKQMDSFFHPIWKSWWMSFQMSSATNDGSETTRAFISSEPDVSIISSLFSYSVILVFSLFFITL